MQDVKETSILEKIGGVQFSMADLAFVTNALQNSLPMVPEEEGEGVSVTQWLQEENTAEFLGYALKRIFVRIGNDCIEDMVSANLRSKSILYIAAQTALNSSPGILSHIQLILDTPLMHAVTSQKIAMMFVQVVGRQHMMTEGEIARTAKNLSKAIFIVISETAKAMKAIGVRLPTRPDPEPAEVVLQMVI